MSADRLRGFERSILQNNQRGSRKRAGCASISRVDWAGPRPCRPSRRKAQFSRAALRVGHDVRRAAPRAAARLPDRSPRPRLARAGWRGLCPCASTLADAWTDLQRANEWCPAGPCFYELGLNVVNVVFEVKFWVLAVERFTCCLGPRLGRVDRVVAIQRV